MGQLYISGQVFHQPGPWGERIPVAGARVEILSGDHAIHGSDLILLATTGANGEFSGLTTEWRTLVPRTVTDPAKPWKSVQVEEPDPNERMLLRARIRQTTPEGVKVATLPVEYKDDITPITPLVVDWGPPGELAIASINGSVCGTGMELLERTMAELAGVPAEITMEAFGESGEPFLELSEPAARRRHLAAAMHLRAEDISRIGTVLSGVDAAEADKSDNFWASLVVASIVFAPVTGQASSCLGLALMRILAAGYRILSARKASGSSKSTGVTIRLGRTPPDTAG